MNVRETWEILPELLEGEDEDFTRHIRRLAEAERNQPDASRRTPA